MTGGNGADIVFNTVGDPYFQAANKSLALRGRQILIAAINHIVQFNILYLRIISGRHASVGIDTLGLSSTATGAVLRELAPGFAGGQLKPVEIDQSVIYQLEDAKRAFLCLSSGSSRDRVILRPAGPGSRPNPQNISGPAAGTKPSSFELQRRFYSISATPHDCFVLCAGEPWTDKRPETL